ncbi:MAG: hypothetical protein AAF666_14955 [Pseudomonadota bacterium]
MTLWTPPKVLAGAGSRRVLPTAALVYAWAMDLHKPREIERTARMLDEGDIAAVSAAEDIRARIDYLAAQTQAITTQTQFADAKAAALMTVMGLIALRSPFSERASLTSPLDLATYGMIVVSILLCLWSIIPRFPRKDVCEKILAGDKYSWLGISMGSWTPEQHFEHAHSGDLSALVRDMATSNVGSARVLRKKFMAVRWGFLAGIISVVMMLVRYLPV